MPEIIYVLTNEFMPGLVKVGRTTNLAQRIKDLSSATGVPLPFVCHYAVEVENATILEHTLHQLFSDKRVNLKREFFRLEPERVVVALSIGNFTEVNPDGTAIEPLEREALEKATNAKRARISLEKLGIPVGANLTFSRDETRIAIVQADNKILIENSIRSLSDAASVILQEKSGKYTSVSGSDYWMYDGELLDERRRRLEENQ